MLLNVTISTINNHINWGNPIKLNYWVTTLSPNNSIDTNSDPGESKWLKSLHGHDRVCAQCLGDKRLGT